MSKKVYTSPKLTVHGTVEQLTRMPKYSEAGDGLGQVPYGKVGSGEDNYGAHSRS